MPERSQPGNVTPHFAVHRLRRRAAAGLGEQGSEQAEVDKLFVTTPEGGRPDPKIIDASDIARGLGIPSDQVDRLTVVVRNTRADFSTKGGQQHVVHARARLISVMRSMTPHVPSDVRQEIVRRALSYWKAKAPIDLHRVPQIVAVTKSGGHKYHSRKKINGKWVYDYGPQLGLFGASVKEADVRTAVRAQHAETKFRDRVLTPEELDRRVDNFTKRVMAAHTPGTAPYKTRRKAEESARGGYAAEKARGIELGNVLDLVQPDPSRDSEPMRRVLEAADDPNLYTTGRETPAGWWQPMKPVEIRQDGKGWYIEDGNHRLQAATQAGATEIRVKVSTDSGSEIAVLPIGAVKKSLCVVTLKKAMNGGWGYGPTGHSTPGARTQSLPDFSIYHSPEYQGRREREIEAIENRLADMREKNRGFWGAAPERDPELRYEPSGTEARYVEKNDPKLGTRANNKGPKQQIDRMRAPQKPYERVDAEREDEEEEDEDDDDSRKKRPSRKLVVRRSRNRGRH